MNKDEYVACKQKIERLKDQLSHEPTSLSIANELWNQMGALEDYDIRSGVEAINCYRLVALKSTDGVIALGKAFIDLFNISGEQPRIQQFDEDLINAIANAYKTLSNDDKEIVKFLIDYIRQS